jgi:ZIP family zinc transporter
LFAKTDVSYYLWQWTITAKNNRYQRAIFCLLQTFTDMNDNVQIAFLLTIIAGLSTGIGSAIAFVIKEKSEKILTFAMGLAAGVMLYLSFMEMLPHATHAIAGQLQHAHDSSWITLIAFFSGMVLVAFIERLMPAIHNPHEIEQTPINQSDKKLLRVGLMTAIALAIHNFPEGIATFVSTLEDPQLGLTIAVAIAMHNIPEGIAISMPIYHATGNRRKAFLYSFLSGLVEPLGAILCYCLFIDYLNPLVMGILLAAVAGIMVFISIDQLLPAASKYGEHKMTTYGVVTGMLLMSVSLALFIAHHHVH